MTTVVKAGRYEIVDELGRGAMGIVYKAIDPVIGRTVAVKTIRLSEAGTGLSRPELLKRFQTEARAAGLLTHPNIVVVYDAGEEDGLYYITMELVEGKSVQALLDEGHAFPLPRVLRIMEQTCSALQFAHDRHVIHRDIKPANLMLTADDTVKVTDFGTAKILQFGTVQQTTHVMGTPSYMSPEQVKGRAVDGRSDIFSLGVMLYEMVTGEKPFPGQSITTVIYKIVNEDPVPPRQLNASIHPGISDVIMKALVKNPDERYQNCREMLEDLRNYRAVTGTSGSPQSTMALGAGGTLAPAMALGNANSTPSYFDESRAAATARLLNARGTHPGQTPVLRRTGAILPVAEPKKKKSLVASVLIALMLLGVIAWGANKLKPVFLEARDFYEAKGPEAKETPKPIEVRNQTVAQLSSPSAEPVSSSADPGTLATTASLPPAVAPPTTPGASPVSSKSTPAISEKPVTKQVPLPKSDSTFSAKAAQYKAQVDAVIAKRGLGSRARIDGAGNTLTIEGKLRPMEHAALLKFLRDGPSGVLVIDHIEHDDTLVAAAGDLDEGGHPLASPDRGAIHVLTDVLGATATLYGPAGRQLRQCQTPCSFGGLQEERYSLEVKKDGYRAVQTALQIRTGEVQDQKLTLEPLTLGLYVVSDPAGADVFINGAKQSGQTPVSLPLAPGPYNLVLRMEGYAAYAGAVQVNPGVQTQMKVELHAKDLGKVAWADVQSTPSGAEIVVDGTTTSQFTPARLEVPAGTHTITLKMKGFHPARRPVQVTEGGTVRVQATLRADE
jgi:eukaryotic-like serine/threonine-protein kinase